MVIMMFDPYEVRRDFPILSLMVNGKKLVYLDNAATSQRPVEVIEAIRNFYLKYNANIHRGMHALSQEASRLYEEAHDTVTGFIGARSTEETVFVRNTTEAISLVAYAWGLRNLGKRDEVVVTIMEHHSNLLPWFKVAELTGARIKVVDINDSGFLNYEALGEAITEKTKLIAVSHVSNVTGVVNDVGRIVRAARSVGAKVLLDGAQSVPHMPVNVRELGVDFLAFSGHKMLGPTGIGVLYASKDALEEMGSFIVGGGTVKAVHYDASTGRLRVEWLKSPWRFEAGTPNIAGGIGLAEAIRYLERLGLNNIWSHERMLVQYFFKRISEEGLSGEINIAGPSSSERRGGIVSFTLGNMDPHATALLLGEDGIAVRSGFLCAQPLLERLGYSRGAVRASFYLYNTREEVDMLVNAVKRLAMRQFRGG